MGKKRIDTSADREPLTDNPFAALKRDGSAGQSEEAPKQEVPVSAQKRPYRVVKSKKGNWPLAIEKRSGGKVVTVLRNIEGDAGALLKELKKRCATGGVVREGALEIQGDHRKAVEAFLDGLKG